MNNEINVSPNQIRIQNIDNEIQATFVKKPNGCIGFPCGTGSTEHAAITNLLERASSESKVKFVCWEQ